MKRPSIPMAAMGAYSDGCDHANAWLDRIERPLPALLEACAAWRAHCYAETVKKYEVRPEFLPLLAEWERGFDGTLRGAKQFYAYAGAASSAPGHADMLQRLIMQANALSALLAVADTLPAESRQSVLVSCSMIVNDAARDLAALVGGAA